MSERYAGPDLDALSPEQTVVADAIKSGPRGEIVGPLRVWLTNPEMAQKAQALGQYARFDTGLSAYLSELAILVTARYWTSGFEWVHHAPLAVAAGHSQVVVDAICAARRPELPDAAAIAVFDFAVELHRDKSVTDATFARTQAALGTSGCVDLVAICGYYTLISMTINVFNVADGGAPGLAAISLPPADYFRD